MLRRIVTLVVCLVVGAASAGRAEERPNILFAFADDWGRYASIYAELEPGGPSDIVSTPHFDRVAREGVLFKHAFVNAPSCTPCRSSLLSGQYFWRTGRGAILQGAVWDPAIPSYPLLLKEAGYHIGYTFKVWGPGTPANAPYGADQNAFARRGNKFNQFSQFVSKRDDIETAKQELYEETRGNFRDFLAARQPGQPFCYWFGPTNVHRKWVQGSGKQLWGLDPNALQGKLPKFLPDVPEIREDMADYLGEVQAFDAGLGVLLEELERSGELERTIVVVSGDHGMPGVPRGKCNLYDFGVHVGLAIRWGAQAPPGRVLEDFVCLPDLCPTFLEAAGVSVPKVMTGRSLLPLLKSKESGLIDPTRDAVVVGRERHVGLARDAHLPYPQRAIRTRDYLYIRNFAPDRWPMGQAPGFGLPEGKLPGESDLREETTVVFADMDASPTKAWLLTHLDEPGMAPYIEFAFGRRPAEELYDLRTDPDCLQNIAADPARQPVRSDLSTRLMSVLTSTGDPRVQGDGTTYDKPPFSSLPAENPRRQRTR